MALGQSNDTQSINDKKAPIVKANSSAHKANSPSSSFSRVTPLPRKKPSPKLTQTQKKRPPSQKSKAPENARLLSRSYLPIAKQVQKCDEHYKKSTIKEKDEIAESTEYFQYKTACSNNDTNQPLTWKGKGPGDACILHTTILAAKIFDIDYSLSKCIIIKETGDYLNAAKLGAEMYGNLQLKPTYEIKINASEGNGNGLGQITLPAYQDVMELIDPTDLRENKSTLQKLSRKKFSCKLRHQWHTFFDLTNNGQIPPYKNNPLKSFHPLLSMTVGLTYLSQVVPKRLKQYSVRESIKFNSIDLIDNSDKSYKAERLKQQIAYAGKYNSSYLENSYKKMVAQCISKTEDQYKEIRKSTRLLAQLNSQPSITTPKTNKDSTSAIRGENSISLEDDGASENSPQ